MPQYTIRLASGENDLPHVGHVTTTPRLVWLPEEAVAALRARGAIIDHPAASSVEQADAQEPATVPVPGPVTKPRGKR